MFDKLTKNQIILGRKSVTRRIRKEDNNPPAVVGNIHKLKIDRTKKVYGYLLITSVEKGYFNDLNNIDIIKEGFHSLKEYREYFFKINNVQIQNPPIWIISFKYLKDLKEYEYGT